MTGKRNSSVWILVTALVTVSVIVLAWLLIESNKPATNLNTQPDSAHINGAQPKTPDRVKSQAGANGDTSPSSNGTGPGSNNSLLGQ